MDLQRIIARHLSRSDEPREVGVIPAAADALGRLLVLAAARAGSARVPEDN